MTSIYKYHGSTNRAAVEADIKGPLDQSLAQYQQDTKAISGPQISRPGKRKTTAAGLWGGMADDSGNKRARLPLESGISQNSDVLQKYFPAGQTPMPALDRSTIIAKSGVPVHIYDNDSMSHTFLAQNYLTHMVVLSPDRFNADQYSDKDYMALINPPYVPIVTLRDTNPHLKIDPRGNVMTLGEMHTEINNKFTGQVKEIEERISRHSLLGTALYTACDRDKRGMPYVGLTFVYKGVHDVVHVWNLKGLQEVTVGCKLWFYWACRTRGFEETERLEQLEDRPFSTPPGYEDKRTLRLEPYVTDEHGEPPFHVKNSARLWGIKPLFYGRVIRFLRGKTTSTRFTNHAYEILYPSFESQPPEVYARFVSRMPILTVSKSLT